MVNRVADGLFQGNADAHASACITDPEADQVGLQLHDQGRHQLGVVVEGVVDFHGLQTLVRAVLRQNLDVDSGQESFRNGCHVFGPGGIGGCYSHDPCLPQ